MMDFCTMWHIIIIYHFFFNHYPAFYFNLAKYIIIIATAVNGVRRREN